MKCNTFSWLVWNEVVRLALVLKGSKKWPKSAILQNSFTSLSPFSSHSFTLSNFSLLSLTPHKLQLFSSKLFSILATREIQAGNSITTGSYSGIHDRINRKKSFRDDQALTLWWGRKDVAETTFTSYSLWGILHIATLSAVNESGKPLDPNGPECKSLLYHLLAGWAS